MRSTRSSWRAYGKHLIVEKPMALTLEDADMMIAKCDAAGIKLFVVKQNRYNVPVRKLREALDEGRFGKLVMGTTRVRWCRRQDYYDQASWRGTWALDGGVFANQASHHVDLLQWCMGKPRSVFARGRAALAKIETEDTGAAIINFENGAIGIVEATTATRPADLEGSLSVLGEKGTVEIGGFAANKIKTWSFENPVPGDEEVIAKFHENPPSVYGFGHIAYLQHVIDAVMNEAPSLVDGLEGRKSLELVIAIYESMATGAAGDDRVRRAPKPAGTDDHEQRRAAENAPMRRRKIPLVDLQAQYERYRTELDARREAVVRNTSFIGGADHDAFAREFAAWCGGGACGAGRQWHGRLDAASDRSAGAGRRQGRGRHHQSHLRRHRGGHRQCRLPAGLGRYRPCDLSDVDGGDRSGRSHRQRAQ